MCDLSCECEVNEDCCMAFDGMLKDIKKNQVLVVTGSHFLVAKTIA